MATKKSCKAKKVQESRGKFLAVSMSLAMTIGVGGAAYILGASYADEASKFHDTLSQTVSRVLKERAIPSSEPQPSPDGLFAKLFHRHPNNEVIKGLAFVLDPEGFAKAHPNNEIAKAYGVLSDPEEFIARHPNNELAKALQALTNAKDFYTGHPNNDFGKALHVLADPDDFVKKHPNNEFGKAVQLLRGDLSGFKKAHPSNEITRAVKEVERVPRNIKRCFGLC